MDFAGKQVGDDVDRISHAVALDLGAEHHRVRGQQARAEAEHGPPTRLIVELEMRSATMNGWW